MRRRAAGTDLIIPALAVAFTLYYFWTVTELSWEAKANGIIIGGILLVLVALLLLRIGVQMARGESSLAIDFGGWTEANRRRLALLGITLAFLVLLEPLGTSLSLALMLLASMWVMGARHWPSLIGVSLALPLIVWASLMVFIGTRLPQGPFETLMYALTGLGIAE
jgi:cell division protein FtsW (lipid II flippase)